MLLEKKMIERARRKKERAERGRRESEEREQGSIKKMQSEGMSRVNETKGESKERRREFEKDQLD